ncbi:MAG: hypothetical protein PWQ12_964 [Clostridiales bacterium]|jgi:AcrR family transcriptional regulator|nr:hypothetical protein [Clostridiales bacterium]
MTKGLKTRQFIIENAVALFSKKGYVAVTMKDICESCQMSRGGVYRYFSSTKEIFIAMLETDLAVNQALTEESIRKGVPADRILTIYFEQEVALIHSENNGLYFAIHEFAFAEPDQRESLNKRVKAGIQLLQTILEYGQGTKAFKTFDAEALATHIIYFMDSLKTSSPILDMSKETAEKQVDLLKSMIFIDKKRQS